MVLCMMENLVLDEGVTVEHVTFEISKHTSFKELELTSKDMPKCKGIAIFNHVLDPNIKWYARARALLSTGMTVWGNVDMFESTIDTENVQSLDMPSRISVPQITTTSDQAFHDLTMFTIQASGFRVIGNSTHYATSWIIEDSDGQVVWSLLKSSLYKEKLDVTDIILKANRVYRIKVIFHSSSNDVSPVGSYTIATMANDAIILTNYLDIVDSTKDLVLEINGIDGVKQVAWEIVNFAGNLAISTWKTVTDNTSPSMFKVTVPALTLKESDVYLIKISTDKKELGSRFIPFNTIAISTQAELEAAKEEKKEEEKALTEYELFKFNIFKGNTLWENSEEGRKVLEKIGDGEREREREQTLI